MRNIKACLSHKTDDWRTPTAIYNYFIKELNCIDTFKYKSQEDELQIDYYNQKLFINPPFSKMKEVTEWIIKQLKNNNEIYLLIPARTDTHYFHDLLNESPVIYFIKGRLHYNDSKSAPFPTLLLWFNNSIPVIKRQYSELEQREIELYEQTTNESL